MGTAHSRRLAVGPINRLAAACFYGDARAGTLPNPALQPKYEMVWALEHVDGVEQRSQGPTTGRESLGNKMATNHGDAVGSAGMTKFANSISTIPLGVIVLSNRIVARR